jgi:hypothetical protein
VASFLALAVGALGGRKSTLTSAPRGKKPHALSPTARLGK